MINEKKLIKKIFNTPTKCLNEFSISGGDLTTIARNGILHGCASRQNEIIDMIEELEKEPTECSRNWESECAKLREEMQHIEDMHKEEKETLKRRIAELEHDLMVYEQKWSVIQLIFGK